jgi:hypothetical protein
MLPNPDTCAAVVRAEHALMVSRAERRARLLWDTTPPRSGAAEARGGTAPDRWTRLSRAVRGVRWAVRPAHT